MNHDVFVDMPRRTKGQHNAQITGPNIECVLITILIFQFELRKICTQWPCPPTVIIVEEHTLFVRCSAVITHDCEPFVTPGHDHHKLVSSALASADFTVKLDSSIVFINLSFYVQRWTWLTITFVTFLLHTI